MSQPAAVRRRSARRRRSKRGFDDLPPKEETAPTSKKGSQPQTGPIYQAGPLVGMPEPDDEEGFSALNPQEETGEIESGAGGIEKPTLEGEGLPTHAVDFNRTGPLRLQGRTDANFDGGAFHTENMSVTRGTGCSGCRGRGNGCVHVTGTLVTTYSVQTTVTLPSVADFPDLTQCQRERVQRAIDNVLAPHEQEHVRAFETYNGTTRQDIDLNICRSEIDGAIRGMFRTEERARRASARALSAALDPFHFDVDMNCQDRTSALDIETPELEAPGSASVEAEEEEQTV